MADSTGPILLTGGISFANHWIGNGQGPDFTILVATGIAAAVLAGFEHVSQPLAVGIAWISFVSLLLISPTGGRSPLGNLTRLTGIGAAK
jgi:hypothetical protein